MKNFELIMTKYRHYEEDLMDEFQVRYGHEALRGNIDNAVLDQDQCRICFKFGHYGNECPDSAPGTRAMPVLCFWLTGLTNAYHVPPMIDEQYFDPVSRAPGGGGKGKPRSKSVPPPRRETGYSKLKSDWTAKNSWSTRGGLHDKGSGQCNYMYLPPPEYSQAAAAPPEYSRAAAAPKTRDIRSEEQQQQEQPARPNQPQVGYARGNASGRGRAVLGFVQGQPVLGPPTSSLQERIRTAHSCTMLMGLRT